MLGRTRRIHFVGIGGIGMSGIAEVLAESRIRGQRVGCAEVGCDRSLASLACKCASGTTPRNVGAADVVVVSSAIAADNPEVVEARRARCR